MTDDQAAKTPEPDGSPGVEASQPRAESDQDAVVPSPEAQAATETIDDVSIPPTTAQGQHGPVSLRLPSLGKGGAASNPRAIELLGDVNLRVKIELGRTRMLVEDVLRLAEGSVVELDKLAGDPVDVYVNDRPVARGEVLVLNDNFCVRVNEILDSGVTGVSSEAAA